MAFAFRLEVGTVRSQFPRYGVSHANGGDTLGKATLVEEVSLPQRQGDRRFASHVQLLETASGETLVRFAYTTGGVARRGPVTLRARDLDKLRSALERTPRLKEVLLG